MTKSLNGFRSESNNYTSFIYNQGRGGQLRFQETSNGPEKNAIRKPSGSFRGQPPNKQTAQEPVQVEAQQATRYGQPTRRDFR